VGFNVCLERLAECLQVQKLRKAIDEYENDKWRLIAAKIGSGFSPAACQEKAEELEVREGLEEEEEEEEATSSDSRPTSATPLQSYTLPTSQPATSASMHSYTPRSS
jgi:hypothetical protein